MPTELREEVKKHWFANDSLWNEKVEPNILVPLESKGGVDAKGSWQHVLAAAFGRSLETFQAVQRLCDQSQPRQFWADAFVLTRIHFETLVTLEWIAQEPDVRSQKILDEIALKEAHFLDALGDNVQEVHAEKRKQILLEREKIEKKYGLRPGTPSLMPRIKPMVDELVTPLKHKYPNLKWEYEMFYRDVSGFAHPSAWGLMQVISDAPTGGLIVESTPEVGAKALLWNGGWFLRILKLWNDVFKVIPEADVVRWQEEWAREIGFLNQ